MKTSAVWLLCAAATAFGATPLAADPLAAGLGETAMFVSAPVSDSELAGLRGGFTTPGGINVALAVQMDAAINGVLALRTVFRIDQGVPVVAVYAPAPGAAPIAPSVGVGDAGAGTALMVVRTGPAGIASVTPAVPATVNLRVSSGPDVNFGTAPAGWSPLALNVGGAPVATDAGSVSLRQLPSGSVVELVGVQLVVTQIVGQSFANIVQNSANNRTIDTATTVNIDLANTAATAAAVGAARVAGFAGRISAGLVR